MSSASEALAAADVSLASDEELARELHRRQVAKQREAHDLKVRELAERRRQLEVALVTKLGVLIGHDMAMDKVSELTDLFREHFDEENELY